MKKWLLLLTACLFVGSAFAVELPPVLVVELSDASAQTVRNAQALPQALMGKAADLQVVPLFYEPSDPVRHNRWLEYGLNRWFILRSATRTAEALANDLTINQDILSFKMSGLSYAQNFPSDYDNYDMWGLNQMNLPTAWEQQTGNPGVLVSTIDTGCRIDHPDLQANQFVNPGEDLNSNGVWDESDNNGIDDDANGFVDDITGWDFVSTDLSTTPYDPVPGEDYGPRDNSVFPDMHGHGTHVAGTLDAVTDNAIGVAAASWNVTHLPIRAGQAILYNGDLYGIGYDVDFAAAVQYATDMGVRVISISFGGSSFTDSYQAAINYAHSMGVLVFAAAGNNDSDALFYPAAYDNTVAVAATGTGDVRASFSDYGTWVDLAAPGVNIWSTSANNDYSPGDYIAWNGTSMATPNAASVAALLFSYNPAAGPDDVLQAMLDGCDPIDGFNPGYEGLLGAGRVNADNALSNMSGGGLPGPYNLVAYLSQQEGTVWLEWQFDGGGGELQNFNVYRDGVLIDTTPNPFYIDILPDYGSYEYDVSAQYAEGESDLSNSVWIDWYADHPPLVHYAPVPRTGLPYAVVVDHALFQDMELMPGDEIAVYDGDLCVGASVFDGWWPMPITAWQGAPDQELPGFTPGNPMIFRIWRSMSNMEGVALPDYYMGDGTFGFDPYTWVELTGAGAQLEHFAPVPRTGMPYALVVDGAQIGEQQLVFGDEIGVFDGNLCVGGAVVNGDWPLPMVAWQADPGQGVPGFTPGNTIRFRVWSSDQEMELPATAAYSMGDGFFGTPPYSQFTLNASLTLTQTVPIAQRRFEMVSNCVVPPDFPVEDVFASLEDLTIVYQDNGHFYIPGVVNTIGDVVIPEGYRVFSETEDDWVVEGFPVDPMTIYDAGTGHWNWVGYPHTQEMPVVDAMEPMVEHLVIIQNDDGNFYIPGVVNTLNTLVPGDGYMMFVDADVEFTYPSAMLPPDVARHRDSTPSLQATASPDAPASTGLPYVVLVSMSDELILQSPVEVELYDGSLLVGKAYVPEELDITPVVAWQGSPDHGLPGFVSGHEITVQVRGAGGRLIGSELAGKAAAFGEGAYATLSLKAQALPTEFTVGTGYPNPFNPSITLPFSLPASGEVKIAVFNVLGREVFATRRHFNAGQHRYVFDANRVNGELVSGVYFVRMTFDGTSRLQKIILMK